MFRDVYPGNIVDLIEKFAIKVLRSGRFVQAQMPRLDPNELSNTISDGWVRLNGN